jgi:S-formylglutathione hydrolase FrmB
MSQATRSNWHTIEILGKACDVFEPARAQSFAMLFLHDADQRTLATNPIWTGLLETHGLRVICPHGKQSWWSNRICNEFDPELTAERFLLQGILPAFNERWSIEPPRIAVVGEGMGGQGALRLAFRHPAKFPVVAAISAAIDFQNVHGQGSTIDEMYIDREAARQDTAVLHVHPLNWPRNTLFMIDPANDKWWDGNQRLHEKLAAIGILHQSDLATSVGDRGPRYFDVVAPRVIEFVMRSLEAEALRVANSV